MKSQTLFTAKISVEQYSCRFYSNNENNDDDKS